MEQLLGLPPDASAHGPEIDQLIVLVHWLMLVLFVGWGCFFVYTLIRFSKKRNPVASYDGVKSHLSSYVEAFIALIEVLLLVSFSIPLWAKRVNQFPEEKDATVVHVTAEQFMWNVQYPGPDGKFGPRKIELIDSDNPLGLDRSDPDAKDDITTENQLVLPVNKPVLIYLTTKDVIHSFFLPYMRVKQDAIPGEVIPVWFTPVKTSLEMREEMKALISVEPKPMPLDKVSGMTAAEDVMAKDGSAIAHKGDMVTDTMVTIVKSMGMNTMKVNPDMSGKVAMQDYNAGDGSSIMKKGDLITDDAISKLSAAGINTVMAAPEQPMEIACAQLCGLGHYRMRGYLNILSQEDYTKWIADQETALGNGPGATPSDTGAAAPKTAADSAKAVSSVPEEKTH
jgi:cytochrome c oxidase subunit 2